jgi:endonuclease/exonuclease/phosphatase family metal-dependent hydrolase
MNQVRLATFNVHHCEGRDGVIDVGRVGAVISSVDADLVAVQELDRHLPRSHRLDQPAELARATGLEVSFYPTLARFGGEYGMALVAPEPVAAIVEQLPRVGTEEPRAALVATWGGLSVIATHLSTDRTARRLQTEHLGWLAARRRGNPNSVLGGAIPPVVIVGDLNQTRWGLGPFTRRGFTPVRAGPWWIRQIDHVVIGPGVRSARSERRRTDASDHPIVVVDLLF